MINLCNDLIISLLENGGRSRLHFTAYLFSACFHGVDGDGNRSDVSDKSLWECVYCSDVDCG